MLGKRIATAIALFLLLAIATAFVALPNAGAQTSPGSMATYPFIEAVPSPVGVGQKVVVKFGITEGLGSLTEGYENLTITVTKPNNTTQTLGPYRTDSTGGTYMIFTPDTVGTYYLQMHFPEQALKFNSSRTQPAGTIMKASDSEKVALVVQEQPLTLYPAVPLPTEYWTRPIDQQARDWYGISGNWLNSHHYYHRVVLYNDDAPETAHILWTKQLATGGLAGGLYGGVTAGMETGDAYEGFFAASRGVYGSVIINGKLYYNDYSYRADGTGVEENVVCVDLHTGEELWVRNWNNTRLRYGQMFYWQSYNYQGVFGFLWAVSGSTWDAYDPLTGRWLYKMTGVPSGQMVYGPRGEIYIYYVDLAKGWMMLWNSSRVVSDQGSFGSAFIGRTFNVSINDYQTRPRNSGYEWNKTIPTGLVGGIVEAFFDDRLIGADLTTLEFGFTYKDTVTVWAVSLKKGQEGTLLFSKTWQRPAAMGGNQSIAWRDSSIEDKLGILWSKERRQHYGVSLETGELLWGPTTSTPYLDFLEGTVLTSHIVAYGNLYTSGVGGVVSCYDGKTGALLWNYTAVDPYHDTEIGNDWWVGIVFITDGKLYLGHGEHSPNQPLPRGAPFICLNATTGEEIWRIDGAFRQTGWGGLAIIGDSIIATQDLYSQRIFAVGKGPTATTIDAPLTAVTLGSSIVLRGKVADISPGTDDPALTKRFPNGVPAVSDASMSDWMLYVYKQFQRPTDAVGVEVTLSVLDANNNYREIGKTTTNSDGFYTFNWKPDIPGQYTVYASFAGSKAYWSSHADTSFAVDEAPIEPAPEYPQPIDNTMTIVGAAAAILIAVIIGFVALYLMLRKR